MNNLFPDAEKDWRKKKRVTEVRRLDGITNSMDMNLGKFWEMVSNREVWHATVHGVAKSQTLLTNWKTNNHIQYKIKFYAAAI